ncbi:MAG TPA: M23 family metallopeptidase, partial [Anaerolineales bacterium]|nr:M23 family metallopeptidase [Anaerolineales bacterium]
GLGGAAEEDLRHLGEPAEAVHHRLRFYLTVGTVLLVMLTPPPTDNPDGGHQGVDFTYWEGAYGHFVSLPVQALFAGQVAGVERGRFPYGNAVMIATRAEALSPAWQDLLGLQPREALYTLYAHLAEPPPFAIGQAVACGETLGHMGCSGNCGNPHLHLELRRGPAGETFPQGWTFQSREHSEASDQAYRWWRFEGPFALLDPWEILLQARERGLLSQP